VAGANEQSEPEGELVEPEADAVESEPEQAALLAALLDAQSEDEAGTARRDAPAPAPRLRVGRLIGWQRGPKVEFPGNTRGPLVARSVIPLDPKIVAAAIAAGQGVVLQFEDGRPDAPIITGLLQPLDDSDDSDASQAPSEEVELETPSDETPEARIDGRRVELEAADEIVLRCGKASIVLRRNGRVVIRGTYVETRSRGVNRIKGGSVEIN